MKVRSSLCSASICLAALVAAAGAAPALRADDSAEIQALRDEIRAMEQKLSALEQREAQRDRQVPPAPAVSAASSHAAAASAAPSAKVAVSDSGLVATSSDGAGTFHVGGIAQLDSRLFFNDGGGVLNNSFVLRRARITADGTLDKIYSFQFTPEFGNGSGGTANAFTLLDANGTIAVTPAVQVKFGKFKSPIGLEQLQGDPVLNFVERSLANNLMPNRDVGIVGGGALAGGTVSYSAGLVNGISDNTSASGNSDFDNDKDFVARVFFQPFVHDKESPLQGLGFGIAGSDGREKGVAAVTAGYKTDGQQTFFKYNAAVFADGDVWRVSPQGCYYAGPFGILGEYAVSAVTVRPSAPAGTVFPAKTELQNKAWQLSAGYVLTGETATYAGLTPRAPFNWANGTWGAWQVVARYADLKIDPKAFPLFAATATNAREAQAFGVGFNWYLTKAVRFSQDYFQTKFTLPAATSSTQILKQDEQALTSRIQIAF